MRHNAGHVTLIVQDLRLVEDVINVMDGQPAGATREEMRGHLNQDGGAPGGAPPTLHPRRGVHSGVGDRSASEERDVRGAQGDKDTRHMSTGAVVAVVVGW